MTKERRLAIQMWRMIREKVRRRKRPMTPLELFHIKKDFCVEHGVKWWHHCWFCQYMRGESDTDEGCQRCLLADKTDSAVMAGYESGCTEGIYRDVLHGETVAVRVLACNIIIQALQGEDPYEED